jgi:hypothetical protein
MSSADTNAVPQQGSLPNDGRVYRPFVLLTGGQDKAIDALHIAFQALNELTEGDEIEAALRYLISRFQVQIRSQIRQGGRYGCTHCD